MEDILVCRACLLSAKAQDGIPTKTCPGCGASTWLIIPANDPEAVYSVRFLEWMRRDEYRLQKMVAQLAAHHRVSVQTILEPFVKKKRNRS